ncbi:MAG TPA: LptF/LptG family permease [Acidobacteriaceae bacterium]|nr:LptF/LptG family permease [Acidobacteriaceae bacterium]
MRILTRYILGETLSHALLGGALFTFVLFMRDLGHILEIVVRNSASLSSVGKIILLTLPNALTVTIPMAVLVGVLLGLSRLAADSEITAMRSAGFGVFTFVRILAVVAAGAWLLGLVNSLYIAPRAASALLDLESSLKTSQASFEVQPRVFYEDLRNYVLYVQDVRPAVGSAHWQHIFLADISQAAAPSITTAEQATVVSPRDDQTLLMRLHNGQQHQTEPSDPTRYDISTFAETDLPIALTPQMTHSGRNDTPLLAMSNSQLLERARQPGGKPYRIELHKRFSYPAACFVLMLVGIPLGLSARRGGKSTGFVLTILLVFLYYFLSSVGVALARQDKVPVFIGVWSANILFTVAAVMLLRQMVRGRLELPAFLTNLRLRKNPAEIAPDGPLAQVSPYYAPARARRWMFNNGRFPLLLDDYVLREFVTSFLLVQVTFVLLALLFSFFELLGDIVRNRAPLITVGEYLINLSPMMIYTITPLSVLIAVLITMGLLNRNSELTAIKATGVSLYRVITPVLLIAATIGAMLFAFDELYLPAANRRQEALRSVIKGKPAQTFLRPDRKWMFGAQQPDKPEHIFYYQFFDPDRDQFANISIFEFSPNSFELSRRIYATAAHWEPRLNRWVFERGWERTFNGNEVAGYSTFDVRTYPEIAESPQYFKKESLQSFEMSFGELRRYIRDLSQSGFDTMRLRVALNHKLSYPVITLVMAVLAVPFALSMGRRGSLTGIAVAIGVAIAYWVAAGLFEAMGNVNTLPPLLAAWSPDLLFGLAGGYLLLRTPT